MEKRFFLFKASFFCVYFSLPQTPCCPFKCVLNKYHGCRVCLNFTITTYDFSFYFVFADACFHRCACHCLAWKMKVIIAYYWKWCRSVIVVTSFLARNGYQPAVQSPNHRNACACILIVLLPVLTGRPSQSSLIKSS